MKTPRVFFSDNGDSNFTVGLHDLIQQHVKPHFIMAEIGSFAGVSSALFANYVDKIHCVDIWNQYVDSGNSSTLLITQDQLKTAEENFDRVVSEYPNIVKIKKTSIDAAKNFADGSLDMIYIDSAHDFKTVNEDIQSWLPKVKIGGIVSGHDIRIEGVKSAVNRNLGGRKLYTYKDTSWLVYK